jgi:thioredoxin-related protein
MNSDHCSAISMVAAPSPQQGTRRNTARDCTALIFSKPWRTWLQTLKILACALALIAPMQPRAATLEMADNLAAATAEKGAARRPIMLFFTQPGCAFCERARRQYIRPLAATPEWSARTRAVEVSRAQKLRGFDGVEATGAEIARRYGVRVYPTVVFVDAGGGALAAPLEGFTVPDFYGAYLEERLQQATARLKGK